jgi:hypothetical protein
MNLKFKFAIILLFFFFNYDESKKINESVFVIKEDHEVEYELINELLNNYKKDKRPDVTVQIRIAINSFQILDILEKDQIMVINCFIDQKWFDKRLKWSKLGPVFLINDFLFYL